MRPRWFLTTLTFALLAAPAGAVSLVYGAGGDPVSLDSGTIVDGNSSVVQMQVYDTLVKFKKALTDAFAMTFADYDWSLPGVAAGQEALPVASP